MQGILEIGGLEYTCYRFGPKCPVVMPRPIDDPRLKKYGVAISLD